MLHLRVMYVQLYLTPTHLCIVMEYAAGGELFDRIVKAGRFSEDEARYFFQQLICGVDYCHQSVSAPTQFLPPPVQRHAICRTSCCKFLAQQQPRQLVYGLSGQERAQSGSCLARTCASSH